VITFGARKITVKEMFDKSLAMCYCLSIKADRG
jgi:hypothetical protein